MFTNSYIVEVSGVITREEACVKQACRFEDEAIVLREYFLQMVEEEPENELDALVSVELGSERGSVPLDTDEDTTLQVDPVGPAKRQASEILSLMRIVRSFSDKKEFDDLQWVSAEVNQISNGTRQETAAVLASWLTDEPERFDGWSHYGISWGGLHFDPRGERIHDEDLTSEQSWASGIPEVDDDVDLFQEILPSGFVPYLRETDDEGHERIVTYLLPKKADDGTWSTEKWGKALGVWLWMSDERRLVPMYRVLEKFQVALDAWVAEKDAAYKAANWGRFHALKRMPPKIGFKQMKAMRAFVKGLADDATNHAFHGMKRDYGWIDHPKPFPGLPRVYGRCTYMVRKFRSFMGKECSVVVRVVSDDADNGVKRPVKKLVNELPVDDYLVNHVDNVDNIDLPF